MHLLSVSLHRVLAVFVCNILLLVRSRRLSFGFADELPASGHPDSAHIETVHDGSKLLACEVSKTDQRFVIHDRDRPFWDYYYAKGSFFSRLLYKDNPELYEPRSLNCHSYTRPPKTSTAFRNLTNPHLPEEIISLIASFDDSSVHCSPCGVVSFRMKFLENCSAPTTAMHFMKVHKEVREEGGFCFQSTWGANRWQTPDKKKWGDQQTLPTCMRLNSFKEDGNLRSGHFDKDRRVFASCLFESDFDNQDFIKEKKTKIKENLAENLRLQKAIDTRRQDIHFIKHIFEG